MDDLFDIVIDAKKRQLYRLNLDLPINQAFIEQVLTKECDSVEISGRSFWVVRKGDFVIIDRFSCLSKQLQTLKKRATHDSLTGCFNKGEIQALLAIYINNFLRYKTPLSIILFDIDFFKKINDTYGHLAGDEILKNLAHITTQMVRDTDQCGRIGGEEFLILLPNTKLPGAMQLAERLREKIERYPFHYKNQSIDITISLGIASVKKGDTAQQLLDRCDQALYRAKSKGRNRFEYI